MNAEKLNAFCDLVEFAHQELSNAEKDRTEVESQFCIDSVENVAMAAHFADFNILSDLCKAVEERIHERSDNGKVLSTDIRSLVDWTSHVLAFLRKPDSKSLAENIVALLNDEEKAYYLPLLMKEKSPLPLTTSNAQAESALIITETAITQAASNDQLNVSEGHKLFIAELQAMAHELSEIADYYIDNTSLIPIFEINRSYTKPLQLLYNTADMIGLNGVAQVAQFIIINVEQVSDAWIAEHKRDFYLALSQWPILLMDYLAHPDNDEFCLSILNHLELSGWPDPIEEAQSRKLLKALVESNKIYHEILDGEKEDLDSFRDCSISIPPELSGELLAVFLADTPLQLDQLQACISLLSSGHYDAELINEIQRITHTIKGSANLVGIKGIANLAHLAEDLFVHYQETLQAPNALEIDTIQEAVDCIATMIEAVEDSSHITDQELFDQAQKIIESLIAFKYGEKSTADFSNTLPLNNFHESEVDKNQVRLNKTDSFEQQETLANHDDTPEAAKSLRVDAAKIDHLFKLVEELTIGIGATHEQIKRLLSISDAFHEQDKKILEHRYELEKTVDVRALAGQQKIRRRFESTTNFDSLELDQYDEIHGSVHSFIETVSDSRELGIEIQEQLLKLDALFLQQQRVNKELQNVVKNTRMVPFRQIKARLERCIRHAAKVTGKQVQFNLNGGNTEINDEVLTTIADSLMHLLRNSVDHGIEPPEQRVTLGKPVSGLIEINVMHQNQFVIIECSDDGLGLNLEKIKTIATNKGLWQRDQLPSTQDAFQLLLQPGFSTKANATQVSGRGVGLDAVNQVIRNLKGELEYQPLPQGGSCFTIKIPIQMLATHALVVQCLNEQFAIPSLQIAQILPPNVAIPISFGDSQQIEWNEEYYELTSLQGLVGYQQGDLSEAASKGHLLLVKNATMQKAVSVDKVVSGLELVIKDTGELLSNRDGVSGVSILGDGSLITVLDLAELIEAESTSFNSFTNHYLQAHETNPNLDELHILIVDDSLSVRKALSELIRDAGYTCQTAIDGTDALSKLKSKTPQVVLTDLEMPKMNGIELAQHIRASDQFKNIPIVMLTSRSLKKHREAAVKAGVTEYLTKPCTDLDLLQHLEQFFNTNSSQDKIRA